MHYLRRFVPSPASGRGEFYAICNIFNRLLQVEEIPLKGMMRKYPIVIIIDKFDDSDSRWDATYFYEKFKQDIPLKGNQDTQTYNLAVKSDEKFSLTRKGTHLDA